MLLLAVVKYTCHTAISQKLPGICF